MSVRKYQAFCIACGCDRGLKTKDRLYLKCQKCCNNDIGRSRLMSKEEAISRLERRGDGVTLVSEWIGASHPATFEDPKYGKWTVKHAGPVVDGKRSHPKRALDIIKEKASKHKHTEETKIKLANLAKGNTHTRGKKRTIEQVVKNSAIQQGVSVEEWKGFSSKNTEIDRNRFKKQGLHKECFIKSKYRCDCCGSKGSMNAHHLNSWKHFPEQRYDVNNLVCLCIFCHKLFHSIYGKGSKTPNTVQQYIEFKEKYHEYRLCEVKS